MNYKLLHILFFFTFICCTQFSFAQRDSTKAAKDGVWWKKGKQYVIVTNDGTEYTGEIVGDNDREVLIMTKTMGKLYIPKYSIKTITLLDKENFSHGEYLDENRHKNFYMVNTNVLPFKPREFRISHVYFFGFSGTYAINENVAVGMQTSLIGSPMGLVLKTSFPVSAGNYVGTDFHIASLTYLSKSSYVGNISAKYTRGDERTNFTVMGGIGFVSILHYGGYQSQAIRDNENDYYFNASFFHRMTKNAGFTAEGWMIPRQSTGVVGLGIRTLKRKDVSWSFGFYNIISSDKVYGTSGSSSSSGTIIRPIPFFGATYTL